MKNITLYIITLGMFLFASCESDLDQYPNVESSAEDVYTSVENYKAVLGKLYVSFVTSGQERGGGNADISSNNGQDYMRYYFNLQELGTDEASYAWYEGDLLGNMSFLSWDANDAWVSDMYYRIFYNITMANEFLRNATDKQIAHFSEEDQSQIRAFRLEARFIRALAYYHALDFFRNIPFVTEDDPIGAYAPPRYEAKDVFAYIESEIKDIEDGMLSSTDQEYGRASRAAAWTLLAKMYLNAEVYVGEDHYTDCITYCNKVIADGYSIEDDFYKLFNADNHLRTNEIIFPLPVDATHTVSWGGTTYITYGSVSNTSDYQVPGDYGIGSGWGSIRVRPELPNLFSDNDIRANAFFTEGQTLDIETFSEQSNGYFYNKFTNLNDAGEASTEDDAGGVNTDFPLFRLSDVYLMLAESVLRGGSGSSRATALELVNEIRARAYGENYETEGKLNDADLTLNFIIDERARELAFECTRRTDLVRYNRFTTSEYNWQWKGGIKEGKSVDSKYNYYPIPTSDLTANPNLYNDEY